MVVLLVVVVEVEWLEWIGCSDVLQTKRFGV